jgi:hypothetical protein
MEIWLGLVSDGIALWDAGVEEMFCCARVERRHSNALCAEWVKHCRERLSRGNGLTVRCRGWMGNASPARSARQQGRFLQRVSDLAEPTVPKAVLNRFDDGEPGCQPRSEVTVIARQAKFRDMQDQMRSQSE